MIALRFRFPVGRYHATPWGRHVNEAALAWPPEPVRILRALIACHHRKADKTQFSDNALADLIDVLAAELPVYHLPEIVHAHTRHYMPSAIRTTLVFDAFARLDPEKLLIVGWPGAALSSEQRAHLDHLAVRLGYLGRAESWVEATAVEWDGQDANAQTLCISDGSHDGGHVDRRFDRRLVPLYAPLSSDEYRATRERLIQEERERRRANWMKKSKLTEKVLDKDMKEFLVTLPERLACALAVDTSDIQVVGWSNPPATRRVLYTVPEQTGAARGRRCPRAVRNHSGLTVARFVLAGRPRPRLEDALKIGEIARAALMSLGKGAPPPEFSGRGAKGPQRDDPEHAHAFFLPEDADGDGQIDHLIVYCRRGFSSEARRRLDSLTKLWLAHGRSDDDGERGRKEWWLALEDIASPEAFARSSTFLRTARIWTSVTPYLMPWHAKPGFDVPEQIRREIGRRRITDAPIEIEIDKGKNPLRFHRIRSRRGLVQPDKAGSFVKLAFAEPVQGPLALGFACHYGLGLFAAAPPP
jgi:CRISPR-associated protein Csb2